MSYREKSFEILIYTIISHINIQPHLAYYVYIYTHHLAYKSTATSRILCTHIYIYIYTHTISHINLHSHISHTMYIYIYTPHLAYKSTATSRILCIYIYIYISVLWNVCSNLRSLDRNRRFEVGWSTPYLIPRTDGDAGAMLRMWGGSLGNHRIL